MTGSTLRPRPVADKAAIVEDLLTEVWPLMDSGVMRPVIHKVMPLERYELILSSGLSNLSVPGWLTI